MVLIERTQEMAENSNNVNVSGVTGLFLFRLLLCIIIAAHGWARMLADGVGPFGSFLNAHGLVIGILIAWSITLLEIVGSIVMAFGSRFTPHLCALYASIYAAGIFMVHMQEGWFVVGLGRNGMEYSVLLIASLLLVGFNHLPHETRQRFLAFRKNTDN